MWGVRIKSKKRDKSRQVFFSFHPMSRKEAKEMLLHRQCILLSYSFLFGFPATFKHIVTSFVTLGQSRTSSLKLTINVPFVFTWRKTLYGGQMHYKGHWKGWALIIETFLRAEIATSDAAHVSD